MNRMLLVFIACCSTIACKTTWITHPESVASPEESYLTLRAAFLSEQPGLIYDCLSPGYRERLGIRGRSSFKVAYGERKNEFDDISWFLERALPVDAVIEPGHGGARRATLTLELDEHAAILSLVEVPTVTLGFAFPDYDPERHSFYRPWEQGVSVTDGRLTAVHAVDPDLGLDAGTDIEEVRFYSRWLIDDVVLP